jgi:hypothetical protein
VATQTFQIGDEVRIKLAPHRVLTVGRIEGGLHYLLCAVRGYTGSFYSAADLVAA